MDKTPPKNNKERQIFVMWNGYEGGGRNKTNCLARAHFQNPYALENSKDNKPAFS